MSCWSGVVAVADSLISLFIIFPLSILHWRGTWELQDIYFFPSNEPKSWWVSFAVGSNVCVLELLLQPLLIEHLPPDRRCLYVVVSRLHLYIHGWAVMCYWRGLWSLTDLYLGAGWFNSVVIYIVCQVTMVATKTIRTAVGVPVSIKLDTSPDLLEPDLVYKTSPSRIGAFVFDCLFTQFVIVSSSILIWRGIWNLLDEFVFPHRHHRSDVVSLTAGFSVSAIFLFAYYPLSHISRRLDKRPFWKVFFEDIIFVILTWANLLLWRGAWDLCIELFLPKTADRGPELGAWVSHGLGAVGLMTFQVFNTVGLHGIDRDGSYSDGEGIFPIRYLPELFPLKCLQKVTTDVEEADGTLEECPQNGWSNHDPESTVGQDGGTLPFSHDSDDELSTDNEEFGLLGGKSANKKSDSAVPSVKYKGDMQRHGIKHYTANMAAVLSGIHFGDSAVIPTANVDADGVS